MFKKLEKSVRTGAKGIDIRAHLNEDRDLARTALATAEDALREINNVVSTLQSKLTSIGEQVESARLSIPMVAAQKLVDIDHQLEVASKVLAELQGYQVTIVAQEKAARSGKDTVIDADKINNVAEAIEKGREARKAAQAASVLAHQAWLEARDRIAGFSAAIERTTQLFEEALDERRKSQVEAAQALEVQLYGEVQTPTADLVSKLWWANQGNVLAYFQDLQFKLAARNEEIERQRQQAELLRIEAERQEELLKLKVEEEDNGNDFEARVVSAVKKLQAEQAPIPEEHRLATTLDQILSEMHYAYQRNIVARPEPAQQASQILKILEGVLGAPNSVEELEARKLAMRGKFVVWLMTNYGGGVVDHKEKEGPAPRMLPMHAQHVAQVESDTEEDDDLVVVPTNTGALNQQKTGIL